MLIDGRTIANHILAGLVTRVDDLQETYGIQPHLAVIRVGDDPSITSYIRQKEKKAKEIGAVVSVYNFPENVSQAKLKESIAFLQEQSHIHGLILQLPVPKHINYEELILDIHPNKDVDGFRPHSQFVIPIASAILRLLEIPFVKEQQSLLTKVGPLSEVRQRSDLTQQFGLSFQEWLSSKNIVVIGKGKTGGMPIIAQLKSMNIESKIIDSSTPNYSKITQNADIIITAVGKPNILTRDMIKKDAILLSVGMSMNEKGVFVGDYDEEDIKNKASWYTPIPGGVGPVNVACLMENLVIATEESIKS